MTGLDWIILAGTLLFCLSGYHRGFIVGVLSLAGFALGAFVGTRLASALLSAGNASPYAPAFGLFGALLAGAILATGLEGLGLRLRRAVRLPLLDALDGLLGAALAGCVALGIAWVLAALALQAPGSTGLRPDVQRSLILGWLNERLPPSGPILHALARFDPLPSLAGPSAGVAPPSAGIARRPAVRRAASSVVRILGTQCGLGVEGSGWVAGPGLVVTNAHVVAGEHDTIVQADGLPPSLPASVFLFDPHNDVAILRVPDLHRRALALSPNPPAGRPAAIMGFPADGPFDVRPGRVGETQVTLTEDAYGRGPVSRLLTPLRGHVRQGNSGGPMVDGAGRVATTVFAATAGAAAHGGYGVANSVVATDLSRAHGPVSPGSCAG